MKRFLSVLLAIAFVMGIFATGAFAAGAGTSYTLEGTDATVTMPEGWLVMTRDSKEDDPAISIFSALGLSYNQLMDNMTQSNTYLYAFQLEKNTELNFTTADYNFTDFNLISDTMLDAFKDTLMEQLGQALGVPVEIVEYYQHTQAKFIVCKYHATNDGVSYYCRQYYTVYANKAINLTFNKFGDDFDESEIAEQKAIVDSLRFGTEPVKAEEKTELTEASRYTDPDSGFSFVIPTGWTEEPLSKEREYIKAKFCSEKESGLSVVYGCTDVYALANADGSLTAAGLTRQNFGDYFSVEDVISGLEGMTVLSRETYGGCDFILLEGNASAYGLSVPCIYAYSLTKGYVITFQFFGNTENAGYPDFIDMLSSIDFD